MDVDSEDDGMDVFDAISESNENQESSNNNNEDSRIKEYKDKFMNKKKELTEEQKKIREQKNIAKYCRRNDEMLKLLEKIKNKENNSYNLNRTVTLMIRDLSDVAKFDSSKNISEKKAKIFDRLINLSEIHFKKFFYELSDHTTYKGSSRSITYKNIGKANKILKDFEIDYQKILTEIENLEKNGKIDEANKLKKKNIPVREIIKNRTDRLDQLQEIDDVLGGEDDDISSDSEGSELDDSENDDYDSDNDDGSNSRISGNNFKTQEILRRMEQKKLEEENKKKEEEEKRKKEEEEKKKKFEEERKKKEEKKRKEEEEKRKKEEEDERRNRDENDLDLFQ